MERRNAFKVALLSATALTLIACSEATDEVLVYDSVGACVAAGQQDEAVCESEFEKAQSIHEGVAPRYAESNQCYSDFGHNRCYRSGSIWLPLMVGYMLAPRGGPAYISSQPLYRPSSDPNRFYTAADHRVGAASASGRAQAATSKVSQPAARTRTVARGGFGARAAGRGAGS